MEFEGTTSISQFSAADTARALASWIDGLKEPNQYALRQPSADALYFEMMRHLEEPVEIDGTSNAWCVTAAVPGRRLALINIVKTSTR
jgi:hypothetical protein